MNERKCRLFFMQWLTSRSYMCLTEFSAVLFERKKFWKWIVFSAHRIQVHRISASIYCVNPYVDFLSVLCNSQVSYYYSVYRFMSIIMKKFALFMSITTFLRTSSIKNHSNALMPLFWRVLLIPIWTQSFKTYKIFSVIVRW